MQYKLLVFYVYSSWSFSSLKQSFKSHPIALSVIVFSVVTLPIVLFPINYFQIEQMSSVLITMPSNILTNKEVVFTPCFYLYFYLHSYNQT